MLDAIARLHEARSDVQPVIVLAPSRTEIEARAIVSQSNSNNVRLVQQQTREALAASDAAAIASGTATLEAALLETPMVIVYKESTINWHTLGRLITVSHYGLVNLVAGEAIATELMQKDLTGENLTRKLLELLDPEANKAMRERLHQVAHKLGEPGASSRAADLILNFLRRASV
jgi:lipid-A-disaccharide synthase